MSTLVLIAILLLLLGASCFWTVRRRTPRAQADPANKLPRAEQMNNFKKHLQAKDSGNQPA